MKTYKQNIYRSSLLLLFLLCSIVTLPTQVHADNPVYTSQTKPVITEGSNEEAFVSVQVTGTTPNACMLTPVPRLFRFSPDSQSDVGAGFGISRAFRISYADGGWFLYDIATGENVGGFSGVAKLPLRILDDSVAQGTHKSVTTMYRDDLVRSHYDCSKPTPSEPVYSGEYAFTTIVTTILDNESVPPQPSTKQKSVTQPATTQVTTAPPTSLASEAFMQGKSQEVQLREAQSASFTVQGSDELHTATITRLTGDQATFVIASEPFEVTLKPGQTGEYDVTDDPINDIQLQILRIQDGIATIAFKRIHSQAGSNPKATSDKKPITVNSTINSHSPARCIAFGSVAIIIAAAVGWAFRRKLLHHSKKPSSKKKIR
jgi:hypothetical protein